MRKLMKSDIVALQTIIKMFAGAEVEITEVLKNNGVVLHGVKIEQPSGVAPMIYLESYAVPTEPVDYFNIGKQIAEDYKKQVKNMPDYTHVTQMMRELEKVKHHLFPRLVNRKTNEEFLKDVAWKPFLDDLAIYAVVVVETSETEMRITKVTNEEASLWGVSPSEVVDLAMSNLDPAKANVQGMYDMLLGKAPQFIDDFKKVEDIPMYILTYGNGIDGAVAVVFDSVLQKLCTKLNTDKLFVIPSSIHEVLVIPPMSDMSESDVTEMVKNVNATALTAEEVLGDHVYVYDVNDGWQKAN